MNEQTCEIGIFFSDLQGRTWVRIRLGISVRRPASISFYTRMYYAYLYGDDFKFQSCRSAEHDKSSILDVNGSIIALEINFVGPVII